MSKIVVDVVDHGCGNCAPLASVMKRAGFRPFLRRDPKGESSAQVLILPGVGNFSSAASKLNDTGLADYVSQWAHKGGPVIGICLGMQLLFSGSEESSKQRGLGLIPGTVVALDQQRFHIGWNSVTFGEQHSGSEDFFFNHSYHVKTEERYVSGYTNFDGKSLVAAVQKGNVVGYQFHPEKSQCAGIELLKKTIKGCVNG